MAAYRQINVVVGNGKKLATLMNKRNKTEIQGQEKIQGQKNTGPGLSMTYLKP